MEKVAEIVHDILIEGRHDWIPVDSIISLARAAAQGTSDDFRVIASLVITHLFAEGLVDAGHLGNPGYVAEGNSPDVLRRVLLDCEALGWEPKFGGYWFSNTPKGDELAEQAEREG